MTSFWDVFFQLKHHDDLIVISHLIAIKNSFGNCTALGSDP